MAETTAPPARRARNLLSSYYGASVAVAKEEEVDDMNIDAAHLCVPAGTPCAQPSHALTSGPHRSSRTRRPGRARTLAATPTST